MTTPGSSDFTITRPSVFEMFCYGRFWVINTQMTTILIVMSYFVVWGLGALSGFLILLYCWRRIFLTMVEKGKRVTN